MRKLKWTRGKDPLEVAFFGLNWEPDFRELGGDTITGSSWEIVTAQTSPPSLTISSGALFSSQTTRVLLAGGVLGMTYVLKNTITTQGGQTLEQEVSLTIVNR